MLIFEERGKLEYPEKNLSEQGREPTTNSTHTWCRRRDLKPGHIGGRRALSSLHHPLLPYILFLREKPWGRGWKFSTVSPRDVQPTFLYSRRGFEFHCTLEHRQTKLYTYSFWLRREIQNYIKINLDHSKQWVCMTFHFLCEMGCLCIYVYLEFS